MKLLLTGASGFTGTHLTSYFASKGYKVTRFDADLRDYDLVKEQISKFEFTHVVHMAAKSFVGESDLANIYNTNVVGTTNLLEALKHSKRQLSRVLISSSAAVYGIGDGGSFGEDSETNPVNHYGASKLAMEKLALTYKNEFPITIARPFNYTGALQSHKFIIPKLVNAFKSNSNSIQLGNIDVYREFNDVRYVVRAYEALLTCESAGGIFNICSGNTYSIGDIIKILSNLTGKTIAIEQDPKLLRSNEIREMRGNPEKISGLVTYGPEYSIDKTISWMLES